MLCTLCASLNIIELLSDEGESIGKEHQPTFIALTTSAGKGCSLCSLFRATVLDTYQRVMGWSEDNVQNYQDERDSRGTTRFVIRTTAVDLDKNYAPFEDGYSGLFYLRRALIDGNSGKEGADDDVDEDQVLPWLSMSASTDVPTRIVGRTIGAHSDFGLGKRWIEQCMATHSGCPQASDSELPTRLIDVGLLDGSVEPRLVETKGQQGQYVTLSHCWGASKPPVTDPLTFNTYLQEIPFVSLPRTFQDAITAVRRLGYRYLWIDCFCIIQGDARDWQIECARMAQTFRQSVVTIAGPAAENTDAGFLRERPAPIVEPCELELQDGNSSVLGTVTISFIDYNDSPLPGPEKDSPLATRAWILQERLLSPRILYFGSGKMYWECQSVEWYENLLYPWVEIALPTVSKRILSAPLDDYNLRALWYLIVCTYTECRLTDGNDKLPALSGLAYQVQKMNNDTYLAGLWKEDLLTGLTWYTPNQSVHKPKSLRPAEQNAPSWSWAACDDRVLFLNMFSRPKEPLRIDLEVTDVQAEAVGYDPYGQVTRGRLKGQGRLKASVIRRFHHRELAVYKLYLCVSGTDHRKLAEYYSDAGEAACVQDESDTYERNVVALLIGFGQRNRWVGLAMRADEKVPGVYRRLGLIEHAPLDRSERNAALGVLTEEAAQWFDGCEKVQLDIV